MELHTFDGKYEMIKCIKTEAESAEYSNTYRLVLSIIDGNGSESYFTNTSMEHSFVNIIVL